MCSCDSSRIQAECPSVYSYGLVQVHCEGKVDFGHGEIHRAVFQTLRQSGNCEEMKQLGIVDDRASGQDWDDLSRVAHVNRLTAGADVGADADAAGAAGAAGADVDATEAAGAGVDVDARIGAGADDVDAVADAAVVGEV